MSELQILCVLQAGGMPPPGAPGQGFLILPPNQQGGPANLHVQIRDMSPNSSPGLQPQQPAPAATPPGGPGMDAFAAAETHQRHWAAAQQQQQQQQQQLNHNQVWSLIQCSFFWFYTSHEVLE